MELWLRHRHASALEYDDRVTVASQPDWERLVGRREVISSILWRGDPEFLPTGPSYRQRRHPHERGYRNDAVRNLSYLAGCRGLAERLRPLIGNAKTLVYAPLRGALPIWRVLSQLLPAETMHPYFPVTSSFVRYDPALRIMNRKGRPASGRFTHVLELQRLRPLLSAFQMFLYLDEIVSGGCMSGHVSEMLAEGIHEILPVIACGLADDHGRRSVLHRGKLDGLVRDGRLTAFVWAGCDQLITEDQRFLLGMHYVDYSHGLNAVPMLDEDGREAEEKLRFEADLIAALGGANAEEGALSPVPPPRRTTSA